MANPQMPANMCPLVASYTYGEPGGVIRTEVMGGAPRYALDWDRGTQQYSVSIFLDALQLSVWEAFYHHVIKKGAITFDMKLDSGFGVDWHACNIVPDSYHAVRTGEIYTVVSFVVDAESQAYDMSAADGVAFVDIYAIYGDGLPDFLNILERFATHDSNVLDFGL